VPTVADPAEESTPEDERGDEDGELDDAQIGEILSPADEGEPDDGDELPTDPYVGIEPLPEDSPDEPDVPAEPAEAEGLLDDAELPSDTDDSEGIEADHEPPEEPEPSESLMGDVGEGFDDEPATLDEDLPGLGADEPDGSGDSDLGSLTSHGAEEPIPRANDAYRASFVLPAREPSSALRAGSGPIVAASSDLFWIDEGTETPVRIGLDATRVSSLALVGEARDVALCATAFGRLLRRARLGSEAERLLGLRHVAGTRADPVDLCEVGPRSPRSVLVRLRTGKIARSDDEGTTFELVPGAPDALAISPTGDPVLLLCSGAPRLALSFDGGRSFTMRDLVGPAREVAAGDAPMLAAAGSALVLGEALAGVVVSTDQGATFRRVRGAAGASACAVGVLDGTPVGWLSLYGEAADESLVARVDLATGHAEVVATLSGPTSPDPDLDAELGKIERLAWDGDRLWAAGGFGVAVFRRDSLGH